MQKSADAFRTISEVADDLSLPQHVLRFWETRFPQIRPLKRAGGRRYYRPADVLLLKTIRQLLYDDGYTIKGVQRLIKEQGTRGLGASPPEAIAGLAPDPDLDENALEDPGAPSEDEPAGFEPTDAAPVPDEPGDQVVGRGDRVMTVAMPRTDRAAIAQALAEIEACTRILDALRRP